MRVTSITKQFTAGAIMKLWEAGVIDLNTSINTYLPEEYQYIITYFLTVRLRRVNS
jgi:CubicO group peptidase (beta-lactamase class C family)